MTKIRCVLCSRRTDKSSDRKQIGCDSTWQSIRMHVNKTGQDINKFTKQDYVCLKCYATLSHTRMTDRGINKKSTVRKPVVPEITINKTVLRNFIDIENIANTDSVVQVDDYQNHIHQLVIEKNDQDGTMLSACVDTGEAMI